MFGADVKDSSLKQRVSNSPIDVGLGATAEGQGLPRSERSRILGIVGWVVVVTLAFIQPLTRLMLHAVDSELLSYIPLVPFVAGYLLYIQQRPPATAYRSSAGGTLVLLAVGAAALAAGLRFHQDLSVNDYLASMALAYVSFVLAGGFLFFGAESMAAAAFPAAFMIFLIPPPDAVVHWLETASVLGSAEVSAFLFNITGTPLLRDGVVFAIPGIVLMIAEECSGIHSSWVLFITSLVASHLFLKSPWRRIFLVAFVIPLALVRNGFRIMVIGLLCAHIGPHMIDSFVHRQGGPIFFVLSLGPLFLLLAWLRRQER